MEPALTPMVFEDRSQARWRNARWLALSIAVFALLLFVDVLASLVISPLLPKLPSEARFGAIDMVESPIADVARTRDAASDQGGSPVARPEVSPKTISQLPWLRTAFVVQDDPRSLSDLRVHGDRLDVVIPDFFACVESDGSITEHVHADMLELVARRGLSLWPRLANVDEKGAWQGDAIAELLKDPQAADQLTENVLEALTRLHAQGLNVDFESLDPASRDAYLDWLDNLSRELHNRGMGLSVDVPVNDESYDYEMLGKIADFVVAMVYDEHFPGGEPGAVASMEWFTDGVDQLRQRIPAQKLVIALGAYGYDWKVGARQPAASLSFTDAMLLADTTGAEIETHKEQLNSSFRYKDPSGAGHEVWLLDAVSAWNQFLVVKQNQCRGISLWRMGLEEPGIWGFFGGDANASFDPAELSKVSCAQGVCFIGDGEILRVLRMPQDGKRNISLDGKTVDYANYDRLPSCYEVERSGKAPAKKVALTFDDGPDPKWTPQILSVLHDNNVRGTFFVVGQQAQANPQLVQSEWNSGHLVGSHSFSHPNIGEVSDSRLRLELNLTQRVLESITGRQTLLFRAPYDTDTTPEAPDQLRPLHSVSDLGYMVVGADIDSDDYARPGPQQIVKNVIAGLKSQANIIVFHDAGGDRSQTVEALKILIPQLKSAGYDLVTVDQLIGVPRDTVMPPIDLGERVMILGESAWTWLDSSGWAILKAVFFLSTGVAAARILFLGLLVLKGPKRHPEPSADFAPPVAVLIPAYNEGKVIARTIRSLLDSDYPSLSVLVIDDGSTDNTAEVARELAATDSRVRVITKENGGKSSALNLGFEEAREDYVVTIDADTIIGRQTVRNLVTPFADPSVDAVCGNVQVGNVTNILTAMQDVEYVTSQNYDRRAFESLNCISVVPGATGAWKRSVVLKVGGYSEDTLTEDADLTLSMLRAGAKIVYAPEARSITEAPESAGALFKQRFRWSFGTFQCLWKHRAALLRGALGWVALPNMLVFQIIFPLLSPIGDLVLVASIFRGQFRAVLAGYLAFLLMDLVGSAVAFTLDRRSLTGLWTVLIQRFFYRQFMYVVAIRSLLAAIKGRRYGWNKLQRHGSVVHAAMTAN